MQAAAPAAWANSPSSASQAFPVNAKVAHRAGEADRLPAAAATTPNVPINLHSVAVLAPQVPSAVLAASSAVARGDLWRRWRQCLCGLALLWELPEVVQGCLARGGGGGGEWLLSWLALGRQGRLWLGALALGRVQQVQGVAVDLIF